MQKLKNNKETADLLPKVQRIKTAYDNFCSRLLLFLIVLTILRPFPLQKSLIHLVEGPLKLPGWGLGDLKLTCINFHLSAIFTHTRRGSEIPGTYGSLYHQPGTLEGRSCLPRQPWVSLTAAGSPLSSFDPETVKLNFHRSKSKSFTFFLFSLLLFISILKPGMTASASGILFSKTTDFFCFAAFSLSVPKSVHVIHLEFSRMFDFQTYYQLCRRLDDDVSLGETWGRLQPSLAQCHHSSCIRCHLLGWRYGLYRQILSPWPGWMKAVSV